MRRNTQRLYESIMKVVDRSVRKALNETNMAGISMVNTSDEYRIYNKILNGQKVSKNELRQLDKVPDIYRVKNREELHRIIEFYADNYPNSSLNWIDVSGITDMSMLFSGTKYNGDISQWDVSNVWNMSYMFYYSQFNGDISRWDVSKVTNMYNMFALSKFNSDISGWDVSNVKNMAYMFTGSVFNRDISKWNVSRVNDMREMFLFSSIDQDLSHWDVDNVKDYYDYDVFGYSSMEHKNMSKQREPVCCVILDN